MKNSRPKRKATTMILAATLALCPIGLMAQDLIHLVQRHSMCHGPVRVAPCAVAAVVNGGDSKDDFFT